VPLGLVLAGIGAFAYAKIKQAFSWLTGIEALGTVLVMTQIWSRVYNSMLFGIRLAALVVDSIIKEN